MAQLKIQVFYPPTSGRVVLRTEFDWDRDVEASYVNEDRTMSEFVVETDQKYFYFKPCLTGGVFRVSNHPSSPMAQTHGETTCQ